MCSRAFQIILSELKISMSCYRGDKILSSDWDWAWALDWGLGLEMGVGDLDWGW